MEGEGAWKGRSLLEGLAGHLDEGQHQGAQREGAEAGSQRKSGPSAACSPSARLLPPVAQSTCRHARLIVSRACECRIPAQAGLQLQSLSGSRMHAHTGSTSSGVQRAGKRSLRLRERRQRLKLKMNCTIVRLCR